MGWKPGQGIGPRVDFDVRVKEERTYGCELPPSNDEDYDDLMSTLSFAPKDVEVYIVNPKKNTFGLGYFGLDRRSVFGESIFYHLSGSPTADEVVHILVLVCK